ncbi:hypothetical protein B0J14DRAFT_337011 [Halenospora varia]|nr:hypothetical protein B0J14DRAFT_337011 [Halenospora varia]
MSLSAQYSKAFNSFASWQGKRSNPILFLKVTLILILILFIWYAAIPTAASTWASHTFHDYPTSTKTSSSSESSKTTTTPNNVAVIVENRPLANLIPLILHFSTVLGPDWPIIFYTAKTTKNHLLTTSIPFKRALSSGSVEIRYLPSKYDFKSHRSVTEFLTTPWLWEQLAPAEHVLMFQADSILCANSERTVDDFLSYDLVGAPVAPSFGAGFNGGLSLRNRTLILSILSQSSWKDERDSGVFADYGCGDGKPCLEFEDQWFYHKMLGIEGVRLPSVDVAGEFAVETVWRERALGYHQVERWNEGRLGEVGMWCPEYKLATEDLLVQHG